MEELRPTEYLSAFVDAVLKGITVSEFKEHMQKSLQAYKYSEEFLDHAETLFAMVQNGNYVLLLSDRRAPMDHKYWIRCDSLQQARALKSVYTQDLKYYADIHRLSADID